METETKKLLSIEAHLSKLDIERIEEMEQKLEGVSRRSTTNSHRISKLEVGQVKTRNAGSERPNNLLKTHEVFIEKQWQNIHIFK